VPGYAWLSLTTDYGLSDGFVAACHGVVGRIAPAVRVIDVSHLVPPGDVARGATVLAQTVGHLPPAVHVAVVDPGVGTARRGVALRTPGGLLVGPDNGLLPRAGGVLGGIVEAVELTSAEWFPDPSRTFHGRDVFAPAAARFALGAPLTDAGPAVDPATLVRLPEPVLVTVDHFGNVQLSAPGSALRRLGPVVRIGARRAVRGGTFGDAPTGGLVVYPDSADHLAVAVNGGRADELLGVTPGDVLRLE
jgi:S-adenosylmethionine hydrolase